LTRGPPIAFSSARLAHGSLIILANGLGRPGSSSTSHLVTLGRDSCSGNNNRSSSDTPLPTTFLYALRLRGVVPFDACRYIAGLILNAAHRGAVLCSQAQHEQSRSNPSTTPTPDPMASSASPTSKASQAQHTRTYQACIPCRRRKVRCDLGPVGRYLCGQRRVAY
jgi:hypothetical protein